MWVTIPEGSMGDCARCRAPATQQIEEKLTRSIEAQLEFNLPEVTTIRCYVCQDCLRPDDVLTQDEPPEEKPLTDAQIIARALKQKCPECGREFDLLDETDAAEWAYGHDCEVGGSS